MTEATQYARTHPSQGEVLKEAQYRHSAGGTVESAAAPISLEFTGRAWPWGWTCQIQTLLLSQSMCLVISLLRALAAHVETVMSAIFILLAESLQSCEDWRYDIRGVA